MNDLVKTMLSLSVSGSALILLLLTLGPLVRKHLSRRWQYYVWLVAVARLLLPFTPEERRNLPAPGLPPSPRWSRIFPFPPLWFRRPLPQLRRRAKAFSRIFG